MQETVEYTANPDKSITFHNIPVGEGEGKQLIDVTLRPLTRRDRTAVNAAAADPDTQEEKLLSLMVTQWGDRPSITSLELLHPDNDDAVVILGNAFQTFFRKDYIFTPSSRNGVVEDSFSA